MADEVCKFPLPWQRWLIGLTLPGILLLGCGLGGAWLEHRTHWIARRLGTYLLQRNEARPARGSVWQGILASRRTRSSLESSTWADSLQQETIPQAVLHGRYLVDRRSADFLVLRVDSRPMSLRPGRLTGPQMQELARSLQAYTQGRQLLAHVSLPRDPFQVHARIRAQLALEDGSLFPLLHQRLLAANSPRAWNFVRMSTEDRQYWHEHLDQILAGPSGEGETSLEPTPEVVDVLQSLIRTWEDSLYAAEIQRLQQAWESSADFELRIVRNMDTFTGYAVAAGELPVRFTIPACRADAARGPARHPEEKP